MCRVRLLQAATVFLYLVLTTAPPFVPVLAALENNSIRQFEFVGETLADGSSQHSLPLTLRQCISEATPQLLAESAGIVGELLDQLKTSRQWLRTIKSSELDVSAEEASLIDSSIYQAALRLEKAEERVNGALELRAKSRSSLPLLVHILGDIYELRFLLRELQWSLSTCGTCKPVGMARALSVSKAADSIVESLLSAADDLRKATAGAVNDIDCWLPCPPAVKPPR